MSMQSSPQESVVVLIWTFELDLKKHFLDVCHDTGPMASEPYKNMSEIRLKLWTFKEIGVERLLIMRFGATIEHYYSSRNSTWLWRYIIFSAFWSSSSIGRAWPSSMYWFTTAQYILAFSDSFANPLSVETSLW